MQLVGSGAASGTMRLDALGPADEPTAAVAIHSCSVSDTTAYVRYPGGQILVSDPRADLEAFITHPETGALEAVQVTHARTELIPYGGAGARLCAEMERLRELLISDGGGSAEGIPTVHLVSRTLADDVWIVAVTSDSTSDQRLRRALLQRACLACSHAPSSPASRPSSPASRPSSLPPHAPPLSRLTPLPPDPPHALCLAAAAATYYLHRPFRPVLAPTRLLMARPPLSGLSLAPMEAIAFAARDGVCIRGYLTRPRGATPGVALPMALVLHGGPNARDHPGFNALAQLLASRGVAVLAINYRGSTGYGRHFYQLGMGQLRGMHNDVEDARAWAVASGVADPRRVAIVGGSWGGYLALGGGTGLGGGSGGAGGALGGGDDPRYAAVVAIVPLAAVGCANDSAAFRSDPLVRSYWRNVYGPAVSSKLPAARELSPLHQLDALHPRSKLLLVHGESDPRVPREHSDRVAAGAQRRGLAGAHVTFAREGHSISREPNVLLLWHLVERFLTKALGLPPPPGIAPELTDGHTCAVHWDSMGLGMGLVA